MRLLHSVWREELGAWGWVVPCHTLKLWQSSDTYKCTLAIWDPSSNKSNNSQTTNQSDGWTDERFARCVFTYAQLWLKSQDKKWKIYRLLGWPKTSPRGWFEIHVNIWTLAPDVGKKLGCPALFLVSILQQGYLGRKLLRNKNWDKVSRRPGIRLQRKIEVSVLSREQNIHLWYPCFCDIVDLQVALLFIMLHVTTPIETDLYLYIVIRGDKC